MARGHLMGLAISACALSVAISSAHADEVKVLTTGIMKGSFPQIAAEFEKSTGHKITMSWGPSSGNSPEAAQVRVKNGEQIDVLIMVDKGMDELSAGGYFKPVERKDIAVSRIGVAVKAGHPLPDISNADAVKRAFLDAKSVGYSEGASGSYIANVLLKKLGIEEQVKPKAKVILGRKFVGESLAEGEVELGLQQISELRLEKGITIVGPLPEDLQKASVVSAAVSPKATSISAARQFYDFLSTPFATSAIKNSGVDLPVTK